MLTRANFQTQLCVPCQYSDAWPSGQTKLDQYSDTYVRSNTCYVYHVITPSAICPHNCRLRPLERYIRQCGDHTVREREWNLRS